MCGICTQDEKSKLLHTKLLSVLRNFKLLSVRIYYFNIVQDQLGISGSSFAVKNTICMAFLQSAEVTKGRLVSGNKLALSHLYWYAVCTVYTGNHNIDQVHCHPRKNIPSARFSWKTQRPTKYMARWLSKRVWQTERTCKDLVHQHHIMRIYKAGPG